MVAEVAEIAVAVSNEQNFWPVEAELWQNLAGAVLAAEGAPVPSEMTLRFVEAAAMAELNREQLGADRPTDVLALPVDTHWWGEAGATKTTIAARDLMLNPEFPTLLGDVIVCPEVARRNVQDASHDTIPELEPFTHPSLDETSGEVALLIAHGTLHLCGYDHGEPAERSAMFARQRRHLNAFFADFAEQPPAASATSTSTSTSTKRRRP